MLFPSVFRSTFDKQLDLLRAAQENLDKANQALSDRDQTIREQADTIRNMDQLVYRMSQALDWPAMQPWFAQLQAGSERRQRLESDRINTLLQTELISIYAPKKETNP